MQAFERHQAGSVHSI